jgi:hypothetical protein
MALLSRSADAGTVKDIPANYFGHGLLALQRQPDHTPSNNTLARKRARPNETTQPSAIATSFSLRGTLPDQRSFVQADGDTAAACSTASPSIKDAAGSSIASSVLRPKVYTTRSHESGLGSSITCRAARIST